MIGGLLASMMLREIPDQLRDGIRSGDLKLYGSIIKSMANGRIVGHLQETSAIGKVIAGALGSPIGAPLEAVKLGVDVVGQAASFVQNEQIKAAISTLQSLQLAGLALGAAGIGVSVVGFAVVAQKLNRVEAKVDAMGDKLDAIGHGIEALRRDHIAEDMDRLRTAAQRMDEGWRLSAPEAQWRDVAGEMHLLQTRFSRRAEEILQHSGTANLAAAEPFLEAVALASAVRVAARLAAGDEAVARAAAHEAATLLDRHGRHYRLADAALAGMRAAKVSAATPEWGAALEQSRDTVRPMIAAMRTREAAATSTTMTLEELDRRQVSGRSWIEAARNESDVPFVFMAG